MTLSNRIDLARAMFGTDREPAAVTRISGTATADSDDGTVTIELEDGDVIEAGCIGSVQSGQTVTVHVQRGHAQVIAAEGWGDALQATADEAAAVANATNQHFWSDTNGAHVTEVTQESWSTTPSGYNSLWNSLGLLFRNALNNLVSIAQSAISFYDGQGNAAANITASFGANGSQIGKSGESHVEIDYHSMRMVDKEDNEYFRVADLADSVGYVQYTFYGDGATTAWKLPADGLTLGVPDVLIYDGNGQSMGRPNSAIVDIDSGIYYIHILPAVASGYYAVAKIEITSTSVPYATFGTRGDGNIGMNSASLGESLIAATKDQTAVGRFNVGDDDGQNAFIIGNGTSNARSNALTVDWDGNLDVAGAISGDISGLFATETKTGTTIGSVSGNGGTKYLSIDISKTGYKPLAVVGYYLSGASRLHIYQLTLDTANAKAEVRLVNKDSSATSATATIDVQVLYVKTSA